MDIASNRRDALSLAAGYFSFFFMLSMEFTYFPSYLLHGIGFSGKQFAFIYAGIPLISLISQPFWGQLADSSKKTGRVIRICTLLGLLCSLPLVYCRSFLAITCSLWGLAFCISTIPALLDTMTVTRFGVKNYGKIRVGGSLGYGGSALLFAACPVKWLIYALPACMFFCWLGSLITGEESRKPEKKKKGFYLPILVRRPVILILLAFAVLHWASNMPYHVIINVHRENLGLPAYVTGYAVAAAIVIESIVISMSGKWLGLAKPRHWLMAAAGFTAVRWLIMSSATSAVVIIATQTLHAFSYGVFFVASISYLNEIVPEEMRATGQTLFTAMAFGVGSMIGSTYTGLLFDLPLLPAEKGFCVFRVATLFSLVSLVIALFIGVSKKGKRATE